MAGSGVNSSAENTVVTDINAVITQLNTMIAGESNESAAEAVYVQVKKRMTDALSDMKTIHAVYP